MDNLLNIEHIKFPDGLNKIPFYLNKTSFEIAISLFEKCNLKCKFCFEEHKNTKIDLDYIHSIPKIVFDKFIIESKRYDIINLINIKVWGGELFMDILEDSMFDEYKKLVDELNFLFKTYNKDIKLVFSWLSNGVFSKRERVIDLLEYSNGSISFSYDPSGRFSNDTQRVAMIDNFYYFKHLNKLNCVSITLTKKTVAEYISGNTDIEKFRGCFFDINFYTANTGWEELLLDDDDIFNFFKWAVDNNFTDIGIIKDCIDTAHGLKVPHYCDCKSNMQFSKGICTMDCAKRASVLPIENFYGKNSTYITEDNCNDIKVSLGINKKNCMLCEYYNTCQMPCWITVIFKGYKPTNCPYKRIYNYIKEISNGK